MAWTRGYGVREVGCEAPVTPETVFQAASISKPVTAMVALRLVDKGLLDLDADVNDAFSTPHNRKKTLIILAICGLLAIAAAAVGIDENLPGIILAFLAATAFVLAFVHPWRTARKFIFLLFASILGFVLYIILNIILDTASQDPATAGALQDLLQSPVVDAFSIIIVMIFPAAIIVGAVGSVAMFIRNRRLPA